MAAILKTLPTFFARGDIDRFFSAFSTFYFTLGCGRPQQGSVTELWFTHHGRILGHFEIEEIVQNAGQLPKLTHEGFRGWRYFDLEKYRGTLAAKISI